MRLHFEILTNIIQKYQEVLVETIETTNFEDYCYKAAKSDKYGTHDASYNNRPKMAVALLYTSTQRNYTLN